MLIIIIDITVSYTHLAVVHNGIIENYLPLKEWLTSKGHVFHSETDTEVLSHLVEEFYEGDLLATVLQLSLIHIFFALDQIACRFSKISCLNNLRFS